MLFQSTNGGVNTYAYYGDITIDSGNSNINVNSAGAVSFDAASFLLNGRQNSFGLSLTTENNGDINIAAGQTADPLTSQINIAGYDISFDLQATASFLSNEGDVYLTAGDGLQISSGTVSIASNEGVTTSSDVSNILQEADGAYTMNVNVVELLTSNGQAYSSVTGNIGISATETSNYHALDTVEINSVNNGIYLNARSNITASAGNNVFFNSDGPLDITSTDFAINSQKDKYMIDTNGNTNIASSSSSKFSTVGDSQVTASDTFNIEGRGVTFTIQVDATLNSDDAFTIESRADAVFSANEIHIDTLKDYTYFGRSLDIIADDEINFESGLDIQFDTKDEDTKFSYGGDGYVVGAHNVTFQSDLLTTINANTIDASAGGDINVSAEDITYTINGSLTESSFNGFYIAGYNTFESASTEFQTQSILARAENGIAVSAFGNVNFVAENNLLHVANNYNADSSLITIGCFFDFFTSTDEKVIFQNDEKAPSLTNVNAGSDITLSAGYTYLSGDSFNLFTAHQSHFFARDSFSLTSAAILFTDATGVTIKSDGIFDFYSGPLTLSSTSAYFTANDAYAGDISFTSTGSSFNLNTGDFIGTASLSTFSATSAVIFSVTNDFTLSTIEYGDIEFFSGTQFTHSTILGGGTYFNSYNYTVAGDTAVSISSIGFDGFKITSSLKQDISFNSGGNLNITSNADIQFTSNDISFHAVETGKIHANTYNVNSVNTLSYTSEDYINVFGTTSVSDKVSGLTTVGGTDDVIIVGGSLAYDFGSGIINANGGGARFYSVNDTSFNTSASANSFNVEAYYLTSYTSENGSISMTSANGEFSINGGASRYTTGVNKTIEITSSYQTEIRSQNNGNVTFYSDYDFIVNAATDISFNGVPGRDSLITSTKNDSDICIRSDFIGDTTFNAGLSMEVQAFGEDGFIQAFADNSVAISSNEYSIGILSEGYQTDPQFILNSTFGILLRTTHEDDDQSGISIQSNTESVSIFAREGFLAASKFGSIDQSADSRIDIRTRFYDADILVQTTKGDINVQTLDGYFLSGTPSIRADTLINSTGHQSWSADSARIQQLSSIQDPSDSAIIFEGYHGDITINSPSGGSHTFHANDGGKIDVEARNGDINYATGDFTATSATGAIELEGRTSATFDAGTTIVLSAQGTGGSVLLATPGGNDVVINAATFIEIASTIGEIDFITTTGLTTLSQSDTLLRGPCVHLIGGGSLEIDAVTDIFIQSTDNAIALDADVEVTVDAARFSVSGPLVDPLVRVRAGGDSTTDGLDITSDGDILFTTQADIELNSVSSSFVSYSNVNFLSTSLNITSYGDSTAQTNIVLQAENGDIVADTPFFLEHSLTQSQVTSQGLLHFVATNDISIDAVREVRYVSSTMDIQASAFSGSATNQVSLATDGDIQFDIGDFFDSYSDSILNIDSGNDFVSTATAGNTDLESLLGSVDVQASNDLTFDGATTDFTSTSEARTELDGYNGVTLTSITSTSVTGQNDIILTSRNDIIYSNIDQLDFIGDTFQAESGSELVLTIGTVVFSGYNFELTAVDDIDIRAAAGAITISADFIQSISYTAGDDLALISPTQGYTADNNIFFTSVAGVDNYNKYGIDLRLLNMNFATSLVNGVFSVDSRGSTQIQNTDTTGDVLLTGIVTYFISSGQSGVQLKGTGVGSTLSQSSSFNIDVTADSGNVFLQGATTFTTTAITGGSIYFSTHNTDGNLRVLASNDASFTSITQTIRPQDDPGMEKGFGNITFTADIITAASTAFDFSSNHDIIATSVGVFTISADTATVAINANRKIELGGSTNTLTATVGISITTAGSLADFLIETSSLTFTATTSYSDTSVGEINILSGGNILEQSRTQITYNSGDSILFLADSSFISVEYTNIEYRASDDFVVNAETNRISNDYSTYSLSTGYLASFAEGEAYIGRISTVTSTNINFESARNFVAVATALAVTATTSVVFNTAGEGDLKGNAAGAISFTATGANGMAWEAHGNLGSYGGGYVLNDDFDNPIKNPNGGYRAYFQNLINENTDAIEGVAVNGAVNLQAAGQISLVSNKGNINFRAIRNVLYAAPNSGSRISFFNVASAPGTRPNYGLYRMFPSGPSGDYCAAGQGSAVITCPGLSLLINKMVNTLIWYGLLAPGNLWPAVTVAPN